MKFSANLGFLWNDRPLPDAIYAAKAAGFDAVECHWPYDIPAEEVRAALDATALPMLGLNTSRGDVAGGENGLAALPGRTQDAHAAIDQAVVYAKAVGAGAIHVMCGFSSGQGAHGTFVDNLRYACNATDKTILIETLNRNDAPGYFLQTTDQARAIIAEVNAPNLKLMFDCYHVGRTEGDILTRLSDLHDIIGHIQFASVPDRGAPDHGELDYATIFAALTDWPAPLGAEYKPGGDTDATLGWMQQFR
ncbi:TIM barrel protein [uncultured Tateyamaria sp.]|uniref:hydroxypyruvate isomerase family protein n=1 Tax=uncultured Tateyamaria sp. TaxID=455651 RepID=UPI002609B3EC|nr:TIM barrel protein [uncultured Tateyamaria sp.]